MKIILKPSFKWLLIPVVFCLGITLSPGQVIYQGDSAQSNRQKILTPKPGPKPRINGPLVYGGHPGHPFLYRIPCQGDRPIKFSVKGLPSQLDIDPSTGIITGTVPTAGEYNLILEASNRFGKDKRGFKIVTGDEIALTPPMGWNSWYAYYAGVTDKLLREATDVMIDNGMADVGYQYINIDDGWANTSKNNSLVKDSLRRGPFRNKDGNILPNYYFPDMKGLVGYIHGKGLKAGIYTSPGSFTCMGLTGSYQHEQQDAQQFADWGFDFLKYDWCSYGRLPGIDRKNLQALQKPYRKMGNILESLDRDIVFNICQYGWGDVWEWGAAVGGNCWRTAGDLGQELDKVFDVALRNAEHRQYSKPGKWNDPDYIQIGWLGRATKYGPPGYTTMPPAKQYAYMSLWSLMAAPLIYSGDMTKLDEFTLNILCNPEVIDVDQDPLGESAKVIHHADSCFLMVKNLIDGSKAVGLFNRGDKAMTITAPWEELQIKGKRYVRDIWRQRNIGKYRHEFSAVVPAQGVVMVKVSSKKIR